MYRGVEGLVRDQARRVSQDGRFLPGGDTQL